MDNENMNNNVPENENKEDINGFVPESENQSADVVPSVNETENTENIGNSGEYHYNRAQYDNIVNNNRSDFSDNRSNNYRPDSYYQQNPVYQQRPDGYGNPPYQMNNKPPKKNAGMKVFAILIAVIVLLAVGLIAAIFATDGFSGADNIPGAEQSSDANGEKLDTDNVGSMDITEGSIDAGEAVSVAQIAQKFNVGILVYQKNSLYTEGSGVIVKEDNDGNYSYIVTCAHVVNHQNVALSVLMEDGTEYPADLVGMDTRTDLAVVRIEASGLPKAEIASSENLVVGQTVYAVGNPGGSEFFGSVTNGIISAIDRPVSSNTGYEMDCIQHTSAINPGNSGGALVNGSGQLVGINSMKIASTEYEGMGFAVPSDVVADVFNSIIENGYVAGRAKLGISYTTPSNYSQTYAMYVQMKGLPTGTIVVASVSADSDLADKDVKEGDMIIAVNGKEMTHSDMLADMIEDMSAGDSLTLTVVRVDTDDWSQTEKTITAKLVEDRGNAAPVTESSDNENNNGNNSGSNSYEDWYEYYKDFFGY